jgi:uncharacterized protein YprB with RNaseH-like and TPR domain
MLSTAVFDLETSSLDANYGVILCGCIKSSITGKITTYRLDKMSRWKEGYRGFDAGVVAAIALDLEAHDVLVAHNGSRFDIPFLRTRMLHHRMHRLPDIKLIDPCSILFRKFRMKSNSLNALLDHLGLKERKTPLDMSVWADAVHNGTRSSMDKIVKHCVADVKALDAAFNVVKPYVNLIDSRGSSL